MEGRNGGRKEGKVEGRVEGKVEGRTGGSKGDLSISCNKMIINSTQKVSSRVLKSRNLMSGARASF